MMKVTRQSVPRLGTAPEVLAWLVVCALIVGSTASVFAAEGDEAGKVESFRSHVAQGAKLRKQQEHRQALAHFDKARAIADHPKLMLVTAELREAIGDCSGARAIYQQALDDKRVSQKLRVRLEEGLAHNEECKPRGAVVVACEPANLQLQTGEREIACGQEITIEAGSHTLLASAQGYRDLEVQINVEPGGKYSHEVALTKLPPQKPEEITVVPKWMSYTAYGSVGAGAALLVAGFASDLSAAGRQEELQQAHAAGEVARANRLVEEAEASQTRTAVMYTSGAILAAAGGLLWIYDEEAANWLADDQRSAVQPQVSVGPEGASVGATIRW